MRHKWLLLFLVLFVIFYAAVLYSTTQPVGQFMNFPYSPNPTPFYFALTYGFAGSLLAAGIATFILRILQVWLKRRFS
jgi:hypothetical protein